VAVELFRRFVDGQDRHALDLLTKSANRIMKIMTRRNASDISQIR
jgi:hypothetical protein